MYITLHCPRNVVNLITQSDYMKYTADCIDLVVSYISEWHADLG